MKYIVLLVFLLISPLGAAEEMCALYENKIVPDHQWRASDFTKEKANHALKQLNLIVNENKRYEWNEIALLKTVIEGYILKRSALEEIKKIGRETKPYYKNHQSTFYAWLIATPIVD